MAPSSLTVSEIDAATAARALAGCEGLDPCGMVESVEELASRGRCFAIDGEARAVYVISTNNGCAWVEAVKGEGPADLTRILDAVIEAQAEGLRSVGCQTARPGLVRKLKRHGWTVAGWIMRKDLQ